MKLLQIMQHHFDVRFLLTPFAIALWTIKNREIKMFYIFGVRIARVHVQ